MRSEQNASIPGKTASSGEHITQQTHAEQTQVAVYRPCIQGPETLRLLDRVMAEKRNFEGDEAKQFQDRLPPLARQRINEELEREWTRRWTEKDRKAGASHSNT